MVVIVMFITIIGLCSMVAKNCMTKTLYTDGKNIKNIAFKNTIQMARAYDMADAIGKITYYIDSQRTKNYLKNTK